MFAHLTPAGLLEAEVRVSGLGGGPSSPAPAGWARTQPAPGVPVLARASQWWRWRGRDERVGSQQRPALPRGDSSRRISGAPQAGPGAPRVLQGRRRAVCNLEGARRGKLKQPLVSCAHPSSQQRPLPPARGGPPPSRAGALSPPLFSGVGPAWSCHLALGSSKPQREGGGAFSSSSPPPPQAQSLEVGRSPGPSLRRGVPLSPRQGCPAEEGLSSED